MFPTERVQTQEKDPRFVQVTDHFILMFPIFLVAGNDMHPLETFRGGNVNVSRDTQTDFKDTTHVTSS